MKDYHENKIVFYIFLSVALHAGVLYAFLFKGHSISGLMSGLGTGNQVAIGQGHDNLLNEPAMLAGGFETGALAEQTTRLDTSPKSNPRPSNERASKSLEIVNIKTKPSQKAPKPLVAKQDVEKPKEKVVDKPKVVSNDSVDNNNIDTENLVEAGKELTPEVIDLDPSDQDVLVIEDSGKQDETHDETNQDETSLSESQMKANEQAQADTIKKPEPLFEETYKVEIPKQLPKPEPLAEKMLLPNEGSLTNTEAGAYAYDLSPNDSGGLDEGTRGSVGIPNTGGADMSGSGEITGAGISDSGLRIFKENDIIPLINAAPIDYPKESIELKEEGIVRMDLYFDNFGNLVDSKITKSSGFIRLDEVARESVSQMRFRAMGYPFVYQTNFDFELEK